jgi:tRNA A37 threonylcarbamoyladenosine modification protein TsaB
LKETVSITIDLSDRELARVILAIDGQEFEYKEATDTRKPQVALSLLERALKEHKLQMKDISKLYAPVGIGSFTGLRVGAAIVNAIASVLHIPINDKELGVLVEPTYE